MVQVSNVVFNDNNKILTFSAENFPPIISADAIFRVNIGEQFKNSLRLIVKDPEDDFSLSVQGGLPPNSELEEVEEGEYIFQWNLLEVTTESLIFVANDSKGATSVFVPTVEMCACANGGNCTLDGLLTSNTTIIMNCRCNEGNLILQGLIMIAILLLI